jgi:4-hydroxy-3-methylbut-2-en-1-yl diphosphate reductase
MDGPRLRILLVAPRGFCAGVQMAVACLDQVVSNFPPPIYAYHRIVHNKGVADSFERRGVVFVDDIDEVPRGGTVVLSAHGVAPQIREAARKRGLNVIDATCPLVTKVHLEARRFAAEGFSIILIGHRGHDEVLGIEGEAPGAIQTIESREEVARLHFADPERVAVLTQTTLSVDETRATLAELRSRFPLVRLPNKEDICYATQNRQEALRSVLANCQLALSLGSSASSNAQRLKELPERFGVASHLIETAEEMKVEWFVGVHCLALTAGASVPEGAVAAVLAWLEARFSVELDERVFREEKISFTLPISVLWAPRVGQRSALFP